MLIHVGLALDGMRPAVPVTVLAETTLGLARLLDLLELRLGLPPVLTKPGQALLAYQHCLAECDAPDRFYHRSFAVDALSAARTLLGWRSQWYEHGWSGRFDAAVPKRLADMAAVEAVAQARVPLTHGQRLTRVLADLDAGRTARIDKLVLHDALDEWPDLWRALFAHFAVEVAPGVSPEPRASTSSDLGRVQRTLRTRLTRDAGVSHEPEKLSADNSFIVVRAISRDLSAQAIAEYLLGKQNASRNTVVIAERDGIIVDNALERIGLPRAGFQHYSRFRAVTQVLKLCLALVWEPVDPRLLLQFLIHSVGPLPAWARSELAGAVADEPGIGGTQWREAIETIAQRQREQHGKTDPELAVLRADIAYWLENERYDPRAGAPIRILIERAQRCTTWLTGRLHAVSDQDDQPAVLYGAAVAQSEGLIAALGELHGRGEERIPRIALEQLVDEVSGHSPDPGAFAQAGHVCATTTPAAITQGWQHVIWWDVAPQGAMTAYPWSEIELAELAREGVRLRPIDERIRMRLEGWLRPLLNTEQQLILVIHERDAGHHPLWTQLKSSFANFTELHLEDALLASAGRATIPALELPTEPLPLKPLPTPRRWWQLPKHSSIPPPETSSYSSLEKLLYRPHEWTLGYPARLKRGRAADLSSQNLLYGKLVHRLLQCFFTDFPNWAQHDEREIEAWLSAFLPTLIRQEGALLYEAGQRVVRERVQTRIEHALTRLLFHLRSAGIVTVAAEEYGTAQFADTTLRGYIDLLLRDQRGLEIVLDVKWGTGRRAEELETNRHLQLATYAFLRRQADGIGPGAGAEAASDSRHRTTKGVWPYGAYYIATTGNVLAHDTSVFPHALAYPTTEGETTGALWARVTAHYAWRRAQLAAGRIEVTAGALRAAIDSAIQRIDLDVDTTTGTREYVTELKLRRHELAQAHCPWSVWMWSSKAGARKKSDAVAAEVREAAAAFERHPAFHTDVRTYVERIYEIAGQTLARFQAIKTERGLIDFQDMEQQVLRALEEPTIRARLAAELDLLLVDEFQDTSPMQLAIFMKLATLARRAIFVGDVKQAIFGFRGCDPELVFATLKALKRGGSTIDVLGSSWRSRPALVSYVNAVFGQAFAGRVPHEQIVLTAQRDERTDEPAVLNWQLEGKDAERAGGIATGIVRLVRSGFRVVDPESGEARAIRWGDIAVLAATNKQVERIARALRGAQVPMKMTLSGLLTVPETCLARACLRRLNDRSDTLATAEIVAMTDCTDPEVWLADRLRWLADGNDSYAWAVQSHPIVGKLEALREEVGTQSPVEVVARVLNYVGIRDVVTAWGPNAIKAMQRQRNLDAFLNLAVEYERHCDAQHSAATLTGFLFWLEHPHSPELDLQPVVTTGDAVHVLTYHKAKGLEWPVVVNAQLDFKWQSRLWDVRVRGPAQFDPQRPLAGRTIHFWPGIFGSRTGSAALARILESETGAACEAQSDAENRRLAYVGLTRARDAVLLVLPASGAKDGTWVQSFAGDYLVPSGERLRLPDGIEIRTSVTTIDSNTGIADAEQFAPRRLRARAPLVGVMRETVNPSAAAPVEGAAVGETVTLGERIAIRGGDMALIGTALHALIAAELINPGRADRLERARAVLVGYGAHSYVDAANVLAAADRLKGWIERRFAPRQILCEVPITHVLDDGRVVRGWIDLLVATNNGWIVLDHKSSPRGRAAWSDEALAHSGQLDVYRRGLIAAGMPVGEIWIHLPVGGGVVRC